MLDGVKSLRNVNSHRGSAKGRLPLVEAFGDLSDSGKESRSGRVEGAEAMLGRGGSKSRREKRENEPFKNFRSRTEEGDWTIGGRDKGGFVRFRDREDEGLFPDRGEVRVFNREVKERG